ncbi:MAG TPA: type II CRISPR RNA-guided endonuclease Cas9, partial [Candidatus Coprenecus stercorigallinarum]|nr:type II CRISPR RNA-guided endonuclease Cas9 [Candidatus Coprenecus stercorigallinarum]
MKKILGLDLGVSSIGWALVNEAENQVEKSSIIRLGVRVNPLTVDEKGNFETGKSITTNADRTLKRSMRRNLQRYKLRRAALIDSLKSYGWIKEDSILVESGKDTTFQTLKLRAKAADEEISLEELARVFLNINKKRGYKSSRKLNKSDNTDEGSLIDGMETARILSEESITPGEYSYRFLCEGKEEKNLPEFYKSDLENEFERIWAFQKQFYPDILTDILKENLKDRNEKQTWAICEKPFNIAGTKRTTKGKELVIENYLWRSQALKEQLNLEQLAVVLQKVNAQLRNSDSYLGRISDRSKELYFKHRTVGQYQLAQLMKDPHSSLKNQVFYRQDYIEEFDRIWETQSRFHPEMTSDKKRNIRDIIIFYQRPLKSQKSLVSYCEFEKGRKVCPKSSPVFQDFKIWQMLNNLKVDGEYLDLKSKQLLFKELSIRKELSKTNTLKLLFGKSKGHDMNFRKLEGNRTQAALFLAYSKILSLSGHDEVDFSKSI